MRLKTEIPSSLTPELTHTHVSEQKVKPEFTHTHTSLSKRLNPSSLTHMSLSGRLNPSSLTHISLSKRSNPSSLTHVSVQEVEEAMESINREKASEIHGVIVEHFLHDSNALLQKVTGTIYSIFRFGEVTEALSIGTLTSVFRIKVRVQRLRTTEGSQFYQPSLRSFKHCCETEFNH